MSTSTLAAPESLADDPEVPEDLPPIVVVPVATAPDPNAPYGRTRDGKPRRKPGPPPRKTPPGPRSSAPPKTSGPRPKVASGPDYATAFAGLMQLPAAVLALAGTRRPELKADAAAFALHTGPISQAVGQTAQEQASVAALLDRIITIGPYGALIATVSPLVLQVLCNHGVIPAGAAGTIPPDQLVAMFDGSPAA